MSATEQREAVGPRARERRLLTTGQAARLLGVSRPTVTAMCDKGDLPYVMVGTHRRLEPDVVQALRERPRRRLTAARRSLWLAHASAGLLVQEPERTLEVARRSLRSMVEARPRGRSRTWLARWEELLDGPVDDILEALTGATAEHDELRQHSPLTAALSDQQRHAVLEAFRAERDRRKASGGTLSDPGAGAADGATG